MSHQWQFMWREVDPAFLEDLIKSIRVARLTVHHFIQLLLELLHHCLLKSAPVASLLLGAGTLYSYYSSLLVFSSGVQMWRRPARLASMSLQILDLKAWEGAHTHDCLRYHSGLRPDHRGRWFILYRTNTKKVISRITCFKFHCFCGCFQICSRRF